MSISTEIRDQIAPVLGRVPSGVFILIAGDGNGRLTGVLTSWIQQASFDPPQVTVSVNNSRYVRDWMQPGMPVTLNQVAKGDNTLFRHFGKGFEPEAPAFEGLETETGRSGLPLLKAAMSSLEGTVSGRMSAGDHEIFLITLTGAVSHRNPADCEPFVHVRKNGFNY